MDASPPDRPSGCSRLQPSPAAAPGRIRRPCGRHRRVPARPPSPMPSAIASPLPAPTTTPAPEIITSAGQILCRDAWGAGPARPGGTRHTLDRMTIHHTAVVLGDNANAPARLRQHQHYHQDSQGWIDIAYHLSVDRNGNIYQLRNPEPRRRHRDQLRPHRPFPRRMRRRLRRGTSDGRAAQRRRTRIRLGRSKFDIATDTLAGHRDESSDTSCPGASLYAHVTSGDLRSRVDGILAAGPVDLPTLCGPEAAAIVADIESGLR